jgi:hypothetical protein
VCTQTTEDFAEGLVWGLVQSQLSRSRISLDHGERPRLPELSEDSSSGYQSGMISFFDEFAIETHMRLNVGRIYTFCFYKATAVAQ